MKINYTGLFKVLGEANRIISPDFENQSIYASALILLLRIITNPQLTKKRPELFRPSFLGSFTFTCGTR
jgi:hypothetical protein